MAIAAIIEFPGGTLENYDEVLRRLGFRPEGPGTVGGIFHWAAATDSGFRVTDVWETREQFEDYYRESVMPVASEVGLAEPEITVLEVHNYLTAGPVEGPTM
jgi:hypothetical protein